MNKLGELYLIHSANQKIKISQSNLQMNKKDDSSKKKKGKI
jgi:hypothetical protein